MCHLVECAAAKALRAQTQAETYQKWKYGWLHIRTGKVGTSQLLCEMTMQQFLSALAWWNNGEWCYWPLTDQPNIGSILAQHQCKNVETR